MRGNDLRTESVSYGDMSTSRKTMEKRSWQRVLLLAVLMVLVVICLGGCKESDVLTEHIEDANAVVDETQEPVYRDNPEAPENPELESLARSQNDNLAFQDETLPDYDKNPNTDETTDQREKQDDSAHDQNATEGDEVGDSDKSAENGAQTGDKGKSDSTKTGDTGGDSTKTDSVSTVTPDETSSGDSGDSGTNGSDAGAGDQGGGSSTGGGGGTGVVYDDGTYTELPENTGTVAAVGQYATIVQMLAGKGALCAADSEWLAQVKASPAFPDEGIDTIATGWSGNGTESGSADVAALIAADPDVVLVGSGSATLSAADTASLQAAGINVVVMPSLGNEDDPDSNITTAVSVVGALLSSASTQYDTAAAAQRYISMHDDALNNCVSANGGYAHKVINGNDMDYIYQGAGDGEATTQLSNRRITTAFVDAWTTEGASSAVADRSYSDQTLNYRNGQVVDTSDGVGLSAKVGASGNFMLIDYYLQCAGVVNNAYDRSKPRSLPYMVIAGDCTNIGLGSLVQTRDAPSALWYRQLGEASVHWYTVGDADFPAIIARTGEIRDHIAASAAKSDGLYNIGQQYAVYVMPSGLAGSWADGTVESYLLAPWALWRFGGATESAASSYVNSFYSTFYRCGAGEGGILSNYDS